MKANDLLAKAAETIAGPRQKDYGSPEESYSRIARFWSAYLNMEIQPSDVTLMMSLLKIARASTSLHQDSLVDLAGYAALTVQVDGPLQTGLREVHSAAPGMKST